MLIPNTKHEGHRSRPVIYSMDPKNEANDMYITCINKAFFLCNEKDKGAEDSPGIKTWFYLLQVQLEKLLLTKLQFDGFFSR